MKFGFMSMSMTYFSSLNMIKAMRQVGTANALFSNPMVTSVFGQVGPGGSVGPAGVNGVSVPAGASVPTLTAAQMGAPATGFMPVGAAGVGSAPRDVSLWTITDVAQWLDVLCLGQYKHVFAEAAVDGSFLLDLNDEVCHFGGGVAYLTACARVCACVRVCMCLCVHVCM